MGFVCKEHKCRGENEMIISLKFNLIADFHPSYFQREMFFIFTKTIIICIGCMIQEFSVPEPMDLKIGDLTTFVRKFVILHSLK